VLVSTLYGLQLVLTVQNLPKMSSSGNPATSGYQCVFTGHGTTLLTPVTRIDTIDTANTTLRCETPPTKRLPLFPADKGTRMVVSLDLPMWSSE